MRRVSLRPYFGKLILAETREEYDRLCKRIFKQENCLTDDKAGQMSFGADSNDILTYLVYADDNAILAHELSHVIFHLFETAGIDPSDSGGEAFCYLLSTLMEDCLR